MTNFYFDQPRNLLIYDRLSPLALGHLPDHQPLNGSFVAVPRTLRNSQVLRWLNYPVAPIMDGYDWPIEPGRKPLEHQKIYANFQVLNPKCFNLGDPGCVAADTLIETSTGMVEISELARRGKPIVVRALTPTGVKFVEAECPFLKGVSDIYRVRFASGRHIDVTAKHFFLTLRGWVSCADLEVGEWLPKFDGVLPESTSELYLSKYLQDAPRSIRIAPNYSKCSQTLSCDERPLADEDTGQFLIPLQVGAQVRIQPSSQTGAPGTKYKNMVQMDGAHLSMQDCGSRIDPEHTLNQVFSPTTIRARRLPRGGILSRQETSPSRVEWLDRSGWGHGFSHYPECTANCAVLRGNESLGTKHPVLSQSAKLNYQSATSCGYRSQASSSLSTCYDSFDTVTSITYIKTDVYYDMHVPIHKNYVAHGLCHHNTMKTLSSLWALDWLMRQHPPGTFRALVVCPLTIIETGWASAIFTNFLQRRSFEILHGTPAKRSALLAKKPDIALINFDGVGIGAKTQNGIKLDGFSKELMEDEDIKLVIIDEARAYGDATSKRSRIARMIFQKKPYLWQLCGSPTPQAPTDCYGMAKLANNALGKSFKTFQYETMMQITPFKWVPRSNGYELARKLLTPAVRFPLDAIWDGPEQTVQPVSQVELSDEQKKLLADLKRDLVIRVKSGETITAVSEGAARLKLLQICAGVVYDSDHEGHVIDNTPRLTEIKNIIDNTTRKVVIFTNFTEAINRLHKQLNDGWRKAKSDVRCEIIYGDTPRAKRAQLLRAFGSEPDLKVIIADPTATSHGVNEFVAADTIIWNGPPDKSDLWNQGNARVRRPGQKYPSTVFRLASTLTEREIFKRLETNTALQGALLETIAKGEV